MFDSPVDEIKNKLDIIDVIGGYIKLQKAGRNYRASCPFHSEKTPSFMVSPERQLWRCFGCGKGGSIFDFIMEMEGVEFGDALRTLAQRAGVELKKLDPAISVKLKTERTRLYEICDLSTRFFIKQLESKTGKNIQKYLSGRGIKTKTIKDWQIGYAPSQWNSLMDFLKKQGYIETEILKTGLIIETEKKTNRSKYYDRFRDRIIFPIKDINGIIVGFTGRENPAHPDERMGKYINTPNTLIYDKSRILYGIDKAKLDIRKNNLCVLVEGQTDVIMGHQAGFNNIIASSGTALTEQQLKIIKRYTDILAMAFDMDVAGEIATKRGADLALQFGFNLKVISLPDNQDPADCFQKNTQTWPNAVKNAQSLIEFYLSNALSKNDLNTAEGKKKTSQDLLPIIKKIPNKVEQAHWLQKVAGELKVQEEVLIEEMGKIKSSTVNTIQDNQPILNQNNLSKGKLNFEEYTLGLILAYPEALKESRKQSRSLFIDTNLEQIFNVLKENRNKKINIKNFKKDLPFVLADKVDYLIFGVEVQKEMIDEFNPKKEIKFCFKELKKRYFQKKLNQLSLSIQEAEEKKDNISLKKLTKEFNKLAKQVI
ncbi:MAG: DNA primase [Parcubacteria group bacterium]|nr:DNA primase [Parcubacteria group bacterium]